MIHSTYKALHVMFIVVYEHNKHHQYRCTLAHAHVLYRSTPTCTEDHSCSAATQDTLTTTQLHHWTIKPAALEQAKRPQTHHREQSHHFFHIRAKSQTNLHKLSYSKPNSNLCVLWITLWPHCTVHAVYTYIYPEVWMTLGGQRQAIGKSQGWLHLKQLSA